jgi:hypothetical protein
VIVNRRVARLAGLVLDVHEQLLMTRIAAVARRLAMSGTQRSAAPESIARQERTDRMIGTVHHDRREWQHEPNERDERDCGPRDPALAQPRLTQVGPECALEFARIDVLVGLQLDRRIEPRRRLGDAQMVPAQIDHVADRELRSSDLGRVDAHAPTAATHDLELVALLAYDRVLRRDRPAEELDALIRGAADRQLFARNLRVVVLGNPVGALAQLA